MPTQYSSFSQFEPNEPAAIIFIVVFGLLFGAHVWQSWRARRDREYCIQSKKGATPSRTDADGSIRQTDTRKLHISSAKCICLSGERM
ncbi:hypothetical protein FRC18_005184 [Serendipita sp. 400]|nr:hypothetical protein FRC18_005184 [Serendipita sp. 400]